MSITPKNEYTKENKIKFPIKYALKVIVAALATEQETKLTIEAIFKNLKIPFQYESTHKSKTAKYLSITYNIKISDKKTFDSLYSQLNKIKGIKAAI